MLLDGRVLFTLMRMPGSSPSGAFISGSHSSGCSPEELLEGRKQRLATRLLESQAWGSILVCSGPARPLEMVIHSLWACARGLAGIPSES